jgi:hypothetical protein
MVGYNYLKLSIIINLKFITMMLNLIDYSEFEKFKSELLQEIKSLGEKKSKQLLKSAEVRKLLGGISAAKLQSLRIGSHLPAINADGLWLYDMDDVMKFIDINKMGGKEVCHE